MQLLISRFQVKILVGTHLAGNFYFSITVDKVRVLHRFSISSIWVQVSHRGRKILMSKQKLDMNWAGSLTINSVTTARNHAWVLVLSILS